MMLLHYGALVNPTISKNTCTDIAWFVFYLNFWYYWCINIALIISMMVVVMVMSRHTVHFSIFLYIFIPYLHSLIPEPRIAILHISFSIPYFALLVAACWLSYCYKCFLSLSESQNVFGSCQKYCTFMTCWSRPHFMGYWDRVFLTPQNSDSHGKTRINGTYFSGTQRRKSCLAVTLIEKSQEWSQSVKVYSKMKLYKPLN
jgi:hypothetical protein